MYDSEELFVIDKPAWTIPSTNSPVSIIDYSPDGSSVLFSHQFGEITIASSYDGSILNTLKTKTQYPITGAKFHPSEDNLLICASRDGFIYTFNCQTSEQINMTRHLGSNLLSLAIDSFGENFAIACADGSIRVYDAENMQRTKALIKSTNRSSSSTPNATIYHLIYHPEDSNIILSASANDRILIWDIRSGTSERCINGPHLHGQGLDMHDGQILTVSSREKKQLELWDFSTLRKIRDFSLDTAMAGGDCFPIAGKIARNGIDLVAGGSGANLSQVFDFVKCDIVGQSNPHQSPVVSLGLSPFGASFINGHENGEINCYMIRMRQL